MKDITNKMGMSQKSLKPTHDGPRAGEVNIKQKEAEASRTAQVEGNQSYGPCVRPRESAEVRGSGVAAMMHPTRPPDHLSQGDVVEISGDTQFFFSNDGGGEGRGEEGASVEKQHFDDDMLDVEAATSSACHPSHQF